jgi:hypothetical protein
MPTLTALSIGPAAGTRATSSRRRPRRRLFLWALYLVSLALIAWLMIGGFSYYTTPYSERPHHPDYRELRPAGHRGLVYGIVGSGMMVLMLVYTLRKRTKLFGRRVPLRPFLDFHIYLGVIGPLFIVLHTSFKVQGLVAIAFWSMVAVAASGYFGRYLYQQIPRNIEDRELTLQEIEEVTGRLEQQMHERGHLSEATLAQFTRTVDAAYAVHGKGVFTAIFSLLIGDLKRPFIAARLRRTLARSRTIPAEALESLLALASERALMHRRLTVLGRVQKLFHYWHVIHKPFAIIMYIIMGVHIGVAIWTGYAWLH